MLRSMCRGKIHRATITEANLDYVGSITIDQQLLDAAGIAIYEQVQVVNVTNGERLFTYAIAGEAGSGEICLNGAAAHRGTPGDIIIIISYGLLDEKEIEALEPRVVMVDGKNRIIEKTAVLT